MINKDPQRSILGLLAFAAVSFVFAAASAAQTPAPSPTAAGGGDYTVTSSVELGVRGLDVNGDHEKYRSDQNYRAGFRIFDSSLYIQDNRSQYRAFDSALFRRAGGAPTRRDRSG